MTTAAERPGSDRVGVSGPAGRSGLQRGVIILPSAFTLGNLFFGVWAMVAAFRGDFIWASWFIVTAAVLDMLDGRVARFTRTGSAFGSELDSLVDAISFGVAPGFLAYVVYFSEGSWSWLLSFVYVSAVVVRLARFNIEQAGRAKSHFHGLPSPTAGMVVATSYPFSQTPFFEAHLGALPWHQMQGVGVVLLGVLMLSHVPYPVVPRIGFRSARGLTTLAAMLGALFAAVTVPRYFFFPFLVLYTVWGLLKSVLMGLQERLPDRDPLLDEDEEDGDEADAELRELDYAELAPKRFRAGPAETPVPDPDAGRGPHRPSTENEDDPEASS
ncbi:MAG TPA: CDP-diacylglycerol--serine O-phosphatidyltransferase [Longimicrobiales bacterium]|nr:CDP-diacylglycerol--serine O-phosphatidyltransferase [Longimicrobiales bacterium]